MLYHMLQHPANSNLHVTNFTVFINRDPGSKSQSEIGHGKWIILDVIATNVTRVPSEISRRRRRFSANVVTINTLSQSYI